MAQLKKKEKSTVQGLVRSHLLVGWLGLFIFLLLGIALEVLHAMKVDFYLDQHNQTRRLMWTLAHTHGTLFSLVNIGFAVTVHALGVRAFPSSISVSLMLGLALMPLGFFLGGLWFRGGDPGVGVFLVPVGGLAMLFGTAQVYRHILRNMGGQRNNNE